MDEMVRDRKVADDQLSARSRTATREDARNGRHPGSAGLGRPFVRSGQSRLQDEHEDQHAHQDALEAVNGDAHQKHSGSAWPGRSR